MMETGKRPKIPVSGTGKSFQTFEVCHANDLKKYGRHQNKLPVSVSYSLVNTLQNESCRMRSLCTVCA